MDEVGADEIDDDDLDGVGLPPAAKVPRRNLCSLYLFFTCFLFYQLFPDTY